MKYLNSHPPFLLSWTLPVSLFLTKRLRPISVSHAWWGGSPCSLHQALLLYMRNPGSQGRGRLHSDKGLWYKGSQMTSAHARSSLPFSPLLTPFQRGLFWYTSTSSLFLLPTLAICRPSPFPSCLTLQRAVCKPQNSPPSLHSPCSWITASSAQSQSYSNPAMFKCCAARLSKPCNTWLLSQEHSPLSP